jgi:TRAP-type uncharacterized transport system fused permease subunit
MQTSVTAATLASAGFLVPFMFVYGPPLLLIGSPTEIALALVSALAGVTALAAAMMGYGRRDLKLWERGLLLIAAVALIFPGLVTDGLGLLLLVTVMARGGETARPVVPREPLPTPEPETMEQGGD